MITSPAAAVAVVVITSRAARRGRHPSGVPSAAPAGRLDAAAQQVLALIIKARAQAGLPGYTVSAGLDTSAGRHNAVMAAG